MVLVHDDDLVRLDGIFESTPLNALQRDLVLNHIRSLEPTLHITRIDLSSTHNCSSVDTQSAWVATLSNVFEKQLAASSQPFGSQTLDPNMPSPLKELSEGSANFGHDLLEHPNPLASLPKQNSPGSTDGLPGYTIDHFMFAPQPRLGPLLPPVPSYGEGPSPELISSHGPEKSHRAAKSPFWTSRASNGFSTTPMVSIRNPSRSTPSHACILDSGNSRNPPTAAPQTQKKLPCLNEGSSTVFVY
ncbi:hypothetical protein V8E53_011584 [Lactarius tabidus]